MDTKKQQAPLHIGNLRESFLQSIGIDTKHDIPTDVLLLQYQQKWPELAAMLYKHSRPVAIKGYSLIVHVEQSVYLSEFQFYKKNIETMIRQMSNGKIKSIKARHGTI